MLFMLYTNRGMLIVVMFGRKLMLGMLVYITKHKCFRLRHYTYMFKTAYAEVQTFLQRV